MLMMADQLRIKKEDNAEDEETQGLDALKNKIKTRKGK